MVATFLHHIIYCCNDTVFIAVKDHGRCRFRNRLGAMHMPLKFYRPIKLGCFCSLLQPCDMKDETVVPVANVSVQTDVAQPVPTAERKNTMPKMLCSTVIDTFVVMCIVVCYFCHLQFHRMLFHVHTSMWNSKV